eukprot:SAG31_NODE_9734_length_1235_cov_1.590669_1_plen_348_part_10
MSHVACNAWRASSQQAQPAQRVPLLALGTMSVAALVVRLAWLGAAPSYVYSGGCEYSAHDWNAVTMHAARDAGTRELCCAACAKSPPCVAGVLDSGGQCYLKTQLTSPTPCSNCTSCLAGELPPPSPSPSPSPAPSPPCGFYLHPCGSFVFPPEEDAQLQLEIDPVTLGLRNLTARSADGRRKQGFLQPMPYYSRYYKSTIELLETPLWKLNVSDCRAFVPNGHSMDASYDAENRSYAVGVDGVLRLRWDGVSLPMQMNSTQRLDVQVTIAPNQNKTGFSLRAAVSLAASSVGTPSGGKICLQTIVLPQIKAWYRSNNSENMFIPDNFGHTGNCDGMCRMDFKDNIYD